MILITIKPLVNDPNFSQPYDIAAVLAFFLDSKWYICEHEVQSTYIPPYNSRDVVVVHAFQELWAHALTFSNRQVSRSARAAFFFFYNASALSRGTKLTDSEESMSLSFNSTFWF